MSTFARRYYVSLLLQHLPEDIMSAFYNQQNQVQLPEDMSESKEIVRRYYVRNLPEFYAKLMWQALRSSTPARL